MQDKNVVYIFLNMSQLRPSDIFYSQDSISNTFCKKTFHSNTFIGKTLDDICEDR